jgi:hypothetical protein
MREPKGFGPFNALARGQQSPWVGFLGLFFFGSFLLEEQKK